VNTASVSPHVSFFLILVSSCVFNVFFSTAMFPATVASISAKLGTADEK
jgi:hypothetical protein